MCKADSGDFLKCGSGFPDYGIFINPSKTRSNFGSAGDESSESLYKQANGRAFIKWCGLLINCSNLELQADYTRYLGQHLSSSISLALYKVRLAAHPNILPPPHNA